MFTHAGQVYVVRFAHHRPTPVQQGYTICEILDGERQLLSRGAAFQHVKDRWRPAIGRRVALDRAVRGLAGHNSTSWDSNAEAIAAKRLRTDFYAAYFASKGRARA